ncbi:GAF domain-containing protein [Pseudarthrobacter sp. MDT3-1]
MKPMPPWLILTLSLASVGVIVGSQVMRAAVPAMDPLWWTLFGIASLGAAIVAWYDKHASARAKENYETKIQALRTEHQNELDLQTSATRVALEDALDPLIESLGAVATADNPKERHARASQVVLQGLHAIAFAISKNGTRIRTNYFTVVLPSPRHEDFRLVRTQSIGRSGKPRDEFNLNNELDRDIFHMLMQDKTRFEPNIATTLPPGMDPDRNRDYCTFISVPARVGQNVEGLVTVDAPTEGDLSESDIPFIRAVATVIATASVLAADASQSQSSAAS